jgi:hypothetical protein
MLSDLTYYSTFFLNSALAVSLAISWRKRLVSRSVSVKRAYLLFSIQALIVGILSGSVLFYALIGGFELLGVAIRFGGHGEVYFASILFNFILSSFWVFFGIALIGWRPGTLTQ